MSSYERVIGRDEVCEIEKAKERVKSARAKVKKPIVETFGRDDYILFLLSVSAVFLFWIFPKILVIAFTCLMAGAWTTDIINEYKTYYKAKRELENAEYKLKLVLMYESLKEVYVKQE